MYKYGVQHGAGRFFFLFLSFFLYNTVRHSGALSPACWDTSTTVPPRVITRTLRVPSLGALPTG